MNNSTISNINNSTVSTTSTDINKNNNKIFKQIWQLGNKYLAIIDESIIENLGIKEEEAEENSITFVEQDLTSDNTTILIRISKI